MTETVSLDAVTGELLLYRLIERQADDTPYASAVSCSDTELTYLELDGWANRLANRLRRIGVRPETKVAVIAERCVESVVALLAVMKAGGVYVPIDPANPPSRFHYLMSDAGAAVLIVSESTRVMAPDGPWTTVASDVDQLADEPASRPEQSTDPDNAAYVIYTSGSTGMPKGVTVSHRQIAHATLAHDELARPVPACFLLLISFSFDANAIGLYWTLTTGGHVVIPTRDEHRDPRALRELIARHRVTHLDCTPSLYSVILGEDAAPLASLHCAIVGGEASHRQLVERHYQLLPDCLLVNNYGPTETTVWATSTVLGAGGPDEVVPIGAPIPGALAHVLDDELRLVPAGSVGELFIGGAGVARGYHDRASLTGERFLPDPWSDRPGARMYRTGDLVRQLPDGQLEFRGRIDHQVKVRGYRIELTEVEQALLAVPNVREAAADVRTLAGAAALVGWVTPAGDEPLDPEEVKAALRGVLPGHMVPSPLVVLDELPRNVAGKVDRTQLADPPPALAGTDSRPMTPTETEVAELAAHILDRDRIGLSDSFFDLGASSLHLSRLALAMWSRFGVGVPIHQLFEHPHVAGAAVMLELARRDKASFAGVSVPELLAEVTLDESIVVDPTLPVGNWTAPRDVLLTGATGYLGSFMVKELIERTEATIWCLVRAESVEHGMERLRKTMRDYLIWDESYADRVRIVVGDLGEPFLGLSEEGFDELAERIDVIHHCGAVVNFIYPYSALKPPNVDSMQTVLRLACAGRLKAVHYVSSIDVFLHTGQDRPYLEDGALVPTEAPHGYARSKWAADHLAVIGRDRGIPVSVYRPGMMMSQSQTGATQTNDFLILQIKGLLEFGVIPDMDYLFDAITIDYGAAAIAHISLRQEGIGRNYHLWNLNPVPITDVHEWVGSFGYEFKPVPLETAMQHLVTLDPNNPLFPLLPLAFEDGYHETLPAFTREVLARTDLRAESANTLAMLEGSGLDCPLMTADLAHKCLAYMVSIGFLPTPEEQRSKLAAKRAESV